MKFISPLLLAFVILPNIAWAKKTKLSFSGFGTYSASLRDSEVVSDFYDGFGYGGSIGLLKKSREYFVSYRYSEQLSNYTNLAEPSYIDQAFRLGFRYSPAKGSFVPVFELAGDFALFGGDGSGYGYGFSTGAGLGLRIGKQIQLRSVVELNMLFYSHESLRRRFFNQRFDLAFVF